MTMKSNWRTSSHTKQDNCVEVADNGPSKVMVRDTKNRDGGTLAFPSASWVNFVEFSKTFRV